MSEDNKNEQQIMVPLDDLDKVEAADSNTLDALAMELATIQQSAKKVAIIGSRNLPITHQQIIEISSGTNAATIRGAMKANPDKLRVILPQTIGQQPSDVQDQLIGVPNIIEHPDRSMMTLADASRICNREIIDECQQLICFLSHTSNTLHKAIQHAEDSHKVVTAFYLD